MFFLGRGGTSTYFHHHTNAYNALLFGGKQWCAPAAPSCTSRAAFRAPCMRRPGRFLFPPLVSDYALHDTMQRWVDRRAGGPAAAAARFQFEPLACEQRAGETLFIPSGWAHGVARPLALLHRWLRGLRLAGATRRAEQGLHRRLGRRGRRPHGAPQAVYPTCSVTNTIILPPSPPPTLNNHQGIMVLVVTQMQMEL